MVLLIFGQPMKALYNFFIDRRIRLGDKLSLIFFVLFLSACRQNKKEEIAIEWNNNQAIGIVVPMSLMEKDDSIEQLLHVRVEDSEADMLGNYSVKEDVAFFQPLVPLSRGLSYEILYRDKLIGKVNVPLADVANAPRLVAAYPSTDTVPENLLKIYFQFSAPMREGEALKHIFLLDEHKDTLPGTFLDLQPELWNKERTVLTLWLDPGRIKRDLIPNEKMGNPLQKGSHYTLVVSQQWKDVQGLSLQNSFQRELFVRKRDDSLPEPQSWQLQLPISSTSNPLQINFQEPLDYFLLEETISIWDEKNMAVPGTMRIKDNEWSVEFIPSQPWKAGPYKLRVASYLEDLAGNNLVRPFDRDITKQEEKKETNFFEENFIIK